MPIVSSAHLVSPRSAEMSEFEFGLIVAGNAFQRWVVHCMSAAGLKDLMPLDVLVLHHVTHRARDKRLADICFIMNIEDTHLINYSLKKLQSLGVVVSKKSGKEVTYCATEEGQARVQRYREIRETCLIDALNADDALNKDIGELARLLRIGACTTRARAPRRRGSEMSEFEFGLIVAGNAFHRWIIHCMSAAGLKDLMPLDVLVLHHVTHRARNKRLADICFIMNVEDTHLINYSLKKLQNLGVVASSKNGKDVTYASTDAGRDYVVRYREIRESCLIDALNADDGLNRDIGELARLLRELLSGQSTTRPAGGPAASSKIDITPRCATCPPLGSGPIRESRDNMARDRHHLLPR